MSYSFHARAEDGVMIRWEEWPQQGYGEAESAADLVVARTVADTVLANLGGNCIISGGGHSNPDRNGVATGWASDCFSISVYRQHDPVVIEEPVDEEEEAQPA